MPGRRQVSRDAVAQECRDCGHGSFDGCRFYVNCGRPVGRLQLIVRTRVGRLGALVAVDVVGSGWRRCQTRRARWRLRQRMASRRVLPSAWRRGGGGGGSGSRRPLGAGRGGGGPVGGGGAAGGGGGGGGGAGGGGGGGGRGRGG